MISAIILAAGESTRMGKPKALVEFFGKTFLETVVTNFKKAGIADIQIVLGHAADTIVAKLSLNTGDYVLNENYEMGQFSSFQTGVKNLKAAATGTFLALVDQPQIGSQVIKKAAAAFAARPDKIIIPTFFGKRGHPPIFPKGLFGEILSTPPSGKANEFIQKHQEHVFEIEVDDENILWNMNTKEDIKQMDDLSSRSV